jgi:hypothetical protein
MDSKALNTEHILQLNLFIFKNGMHKYLPAMNEPFFTRRAAFFISITKKVNIFQCTP